MWKFPHENTRRSREDWQDRPSGPVALQLMVTDW
jgi:hypothetical protein